ncbi:MAG: TrkH family potassium uptake protein [Phycisphaerales bacterium]|nr:TrkH family potassium uptake protein [Phycisphaerales bacterium]
MNLKFLAAQLGRIAQLLGLVLSGIAALFVIVPGADMNFIDAGELSLLATGVLSLASGTGLWLWGKGARMVRTRSLQGDELVRPYRMSRRDAALLTTTAWLVGSLVAGLPFLLWASLSGDAPDAHPFRSAVNCWFEAVSGLTTTGATILSDIEALPRSLLFWRSIIQWLGGLGILMLFVALLPGLGIGAKRLFRFEAPGPSPDGPRPSVRDAARTLWRIYLGLTVAMFVLLMLGGMEWFDSANHTFTTLATGGFSTRNASLARPESMFAEIVIVVFMVAAGSNFGVLHAMFRGRWKTVLRDTEFKVYLALLIVGSLVCTIALTTAGQPLVLTDGAEVPATTGEAVRAATFTVVSQQTTTGFATVDWDLWPFAAKAFIIVLMFVGGSAGSTAGGVKVVRVWIALRTLWAELERFFRPDVVRPLRVAGQVVDDRQQMLVLVHLLGTLLLLGLGAVALMALESSRGEMSFTTAASASLATICTVGPGMDAVGALRNYDWFSDASKGLLCLLMLIGRLELFALAALAHPRFWREQ